MPALTCDGQTVRLTRRDRGRAAGGRLVAAPRRQRQRDLAALGRPAGDDDARRCRTAGCARQQFQGSETGQLQALTGLDQWQVYFFQGNAWANCQSTGDVACRRAHGVPPGRTGQALPSGVRLVLAFAPGSGLNGSLVRDTLLAP